MLDDLISKIKAKLGQSEDDDEFEDEEEEGTGVHESDGDDSEEEVDEAAEKRSKIIKGIVFAGIAYYAVDEFVLKKDPPPPRPKTNNQRTIPQKKKPVATPTAAPVETPAQEITDQPSETSEAPIPEPTTVVEEATPEATAIPEPTMEPEPTMAMGEDEPKENMGAASKELDDLNNAIPDVAEDGQKSDSSEGLDALGKALSKMKEEPKKKLTKATEPPDYIVMGRGLVYNCKGRHWACVDKKSYFQCNQNNKESKKLGKKPACSTVAVYATEEDCQVIQLYNINTQQPTDFCSP